MDFYVDGILSRTITGTTRSSLDSAAIGSVGTGSEVLGDSWIDDVKVEYFDLPQITTQPASQTVAAGGTATFFVETANTVTAYQWQKNGTNIAGATTSALVLSNVQDSDAGSYGVTVSNGAGPVVSAISSTATRSLVLTGCFISFQRVSEMIFFSMSEATSFFVFSSNLSILSLLSMMVTLLVWWPNPAP